MTEKIICVIISGFPTVGSQPPTGYLEWHEWAGVQHKGGLRQKTCPRCSKWRFPQEACLKQGICPQQNREDKLLAAGRPRPGSHVPS